MSDYESKTVVLENSPVEFVLVGPTGKHRGVIVRSKNAGLDLIGVAARGLDDKETWGPSQFGRLFLAKPKVLSVRSHRLRNIEDPSDDRLSDYTLFWKGLARPRERKSLEHELALHAADIHSGITQGDMREIEWHLAPLIAMCSEASARQRSVSRAYLLTVLVSTIVYAIAAAWFLVLRHHPF